MNKHTLKMFRKRLVLSQTSTLPQGTGEWLENKMQNADFITNLFEKTEEVCGKKTSIQKMVEAFKELLDSHCDKVALLVSQDINDNGDIQRTYWTKESGTIGELFTQEEFVASCTAPSYKITFNKGDKKPFAEGYYARKYTMTIDAKKRYKLEKDNRASRYIEEFLMSPKQ
jgi:hypothetical protein